jgi:RNA polymerase-binding protein DksA
MPLDPEQLDRLRAVLTERHTALAAEIRDEVTRAREDTFGNLAGEVTDRGEEAVADLLFDLDNAEVSRDLNELRAIEAALARVGAGSYGTCEDCGEEIAFERLRAQPAATRCVRCQQVHERTFAHPREPRM